MLRELEKAWMAGFIDAEGTVVIDRQVRKDRPSPTYRVKISVCNVDRSTLQPFGEEYGGKIYHRMEARKGVSGSKWSDTFVWRCSSIACMRLLIDVLPYLKLKRAQAKVLMNLLREEPRMPRRGINGMFMRYSKQQVRKLDRVYRSVRILNRSHGCSTGGDGVWSL